MRPVDHLNPYINRLTVKQPIQQKTVTSNSFKGVLTQALDNGKTTPLKISKHAAERMAERRITIDPKEWQAIYEKVSEAKAMGIKESLVVTKDQALVVSPQNETVITVMNRNEASKQIFSNIDGAILLG
jgi:flagellar operon protein